MRKVIDEWWDSGKGGFYNTHPADQPAFLHAILRALHGYRGYEYNNECKIHSETQTQNCFLKQLKSSKLQASTSWMRMDEKGHLGLDGDLVLHRGDPDKEVKLIKMTH